MKITRRQLRQIINEAMSNEGKSLSKEDVANAWAEVTARIESTNKSPNDVNAMKAGAQTLKTLLDNKLNES